MKNCLAAVMAALLFVTLAVAADPSGKWVGKVPGRGDNLIDTTFVLKVEGGQLTGTVDGLGGKKPIANGKVSGDSISFVVEDSERGNQTFKGTVSADEIQFTRTGRRGEPRPFTAKRAR